MSNLIDVRSIEPDVMRGIKRRHCQQYQRACQGCPLFVENDSGLDCAAMIVETALAREHHDEVKS